MHVRYCNMMLWHFSFDFSDWFHYELSRTTAIQFHICIFSDFSVEEFMIFFFVLIRPFAITFQWKYGSVAKVIAQHIVAFASTINLLLIKPLTFVFVVTAFILCHVNGCVSVHTVPINQFGRFNGIRHIVLSRMPKLPHVFDLLSIINATMQFDSGKNSKMPAHFFPPI